MKHTLKNLLIITVLLSTTISHAADNYQKDIEEVVNTEMKQWINKDIIIDAVKSQNDKNKDLTIADMKLLDSKWMAEKRMIKRTLANKIMENDVSHFLKNIQDNNEGLFTEIIVTDNKGMNVGQSIISQNYWQGEQPKWEKTFATKSYNTYISDLNFDENTELFQVEVSFIIMADEEPIGMIYAGIDVERIAEWRKKRGE